MSAPRVWWLPESESHSAHVMYESRDGSLSCYHSSLPPDAIPLVPQASRDELREALIALFKSRGFGRFPASEDAAAVLRVLTERFGLVASPETGEGGQPQKTSGPEGRMDR